MSSMIPIVCMCVTAIMLLWTVYIPHKVNNFKKGVYKCA